MSGGELRDQVDGDSQSPQEIKYYRDPSAMPEGKKVGLSLSFCVQQIARGEISVADIDKIYAATNAPDEATWQTLMESYSKSYWSDNPELAVEIATALKNLGKIVQPRTEGKSSHSVADGSWIMASDEDRWNKAQ